MPFCGVRRRTAGLQDNLRIMMIKSCSACSVVKPSDGFHRVTNMKVLIFVVMITHFLVGPRGPSVQQVDTMMFHGERL